MAYAVKNKKQKVSSVPYKQAARSVKAHEPQLTYSAGKNTLITKEFTYNEFAKIAGKIPFTQKEWADILHISERTLQRYAKDNGIFNFSVADRILQIDKVIKRGIEVFGNLNKFIGWLRSDPPVPEGRLSLRSLGSIDGIEMVITQLGRIEHGILA